MTVAGAALSPAPDPPARTLVSLGSHLHRLRQDHRLPSASAVGRRVQAEAESEYAWAAGIRAGTHTRARPTGPLSAYASPDGPPALLLPAPRLWNLDFPAQPHRDRGFWIFRPAARHRGCALRRVQPRVLRYVPRACRGRRAKCSRPPLRQPCEQIHEEARPLAAAFGCRTACVFGGQKKHMQVTIPMRAQPTLP